MYNYEKQIALIGKYTETEILGFNNAYKNYCFVVDNFNTFWGENRVCTLEQMIKGFLGSSWDFLLAVDFLEKEFKVIQCVYKSPRASDYNLYVISGKFSYEIEKLDQYDFITRIKEVKQSLTLNAA